MSDTELEPSSLVDVHAHVILPQRVRAGERPRGFISEHMRKSILFKLIRRRYDVRSDDPVELGRAYVARLRTDLEQSRFTRAAVLLALDAVYDDRGELDLERSHLYVSNDAVLDLAAEEPGFLAGASINPRRRDAIEEVARVAERGAVLVKWLPNAQLFDPGDEANAPFFRELARYRLPLLVHSGVEYSVVSSNFQQGGDPARWRLALEHGVTVIAAHAGSTGRFFRERYAPTFIAMLGEYPNLFADSSALGIPSRVGMFRHLHRHPLALERLMFGTDYPLPCFPSMLLLRWSPRAFLRARAERNYFDRQARLFEGFGWRPSSRAFDQLMAARTAD